MGSIEDAWTGTYPKGLTVTPGPRPFTVKLEAPGYVPVVTSSSFGSENVKMWAYWEVAVTIAAVVAVFVIVFTVLL